MASQDKLVIMVRLEGIRPLMFDRYAGDNSTQLPPAEKMYLGDGGKLLIPSLNILSLLTAENSKSVCHQFFGRQGKTIALGICSYTTITPFDIPIWDNSGPIYFTGWNEQIYLHSAVARVKGGVPNPKERPVLALPWSVDFVVEYVKNKFCTLENLRQALDMGGTLGLGTFRPVFGRYCLAKFDIT